MPPGKIPWRREWLPTPVFLSRESHGQKSLAGFNPWSYKESDMIERLTLSHFHLTFHKQLCPNKMEELEEVDKIPWNMQSPKTYQREIQNMNRLLINLLDQLLLVGLFIFCISCWSVLGDCILPVIKLNQLQNSQQTKVKNQMASLMNFINHFVSFFFFFCYMAEHSGS